MNDNKNAKLIFNNKEVELDVLHGSVGPSVIDIRKLYGEIGCFTYDPGYGATGSCESAITYIDGEEGILLHRGYSIDDLANKSSFLEVAYLLLNGELPKKEEKEEFENAITLHTMVHEQLINFYRGFRRDAHPMAIMVGVVGALSAFYPDSTNIDDPYERMVSSRRLIAKIPTIAAMAYKYALGQPFNYPLNDLNYSENFLNMCFSVPAEKYKLNKTISDALDKILILHADHEQNASTSTVRIAGSSGANPFACIASGIASLWGPSHGGANEAVLNMLSEIGSKDKIMEYVNKAKDKDDPFRLFGFGHRVYKNYDPRARVLQKIAEKVLKEKHLLDNKLFDLAKELEYLAVNDDYFKEKKLYPNVDFYSGIILKAIGFPVSLFTVIFAVARTVGWVSHWNEMISDQNSKIGRPRQLYTGKPQREFS